MRLTPKDITKLKKKLVQEFEVALEAQLANYAGEGLPGSDQALSLDDVEAIACQVRDKLSPKVAEELAQAEAQAVERTQHPQKHPCEQCGYQAQRRGEQVRTIVTMAGEITLRRTVFYCRRCDRCTMPLDEEMQLPKHGYSAQVEQEVARLSADEAFEPAMEDLRRLARVNVSAKEAQRITQAVGEYAMGLLRAEVPKALRNPESVAPQWHDPKLTIYVLLDGVQTPMREGYQEAKVGAVCVVDERNGKRKTCYTHHLGGPFEIGKQLYALAARMGVAECARVIGLGDGAPWIWRQITMRFPHAVQILDFYHASQHLHEVARVCFKLGENSATAVQEQAKEWVDQAVKEMKAGHTATVIAMVQALPAATEKAREERRKTAQYLTTNRHRMHYDEYEQKGWSIGSGQIESGCKQVVTRRMKQAGMRWKEPMAKAVGCLSALRRSANNLWNSVVGTWRGRGMHLVPTS